MSQLNRALITILGLGWIGFLGLGYGIRSFATPSVVVLVDRSYCAPERWHDLVNIYEDLYQNHQNKQIRIKEVILYSSLGQDSVFPIPTPEELRQESTFGRPDLERQTRLQTAHSNSQLLSCQP